MIPTSSYWLHHLTFPLASSNAWARCACCSWCCRTLPVADCGRELLVLLQEPRRLLLPLTRYSHRRWCWGLLIFLVLSTPKVELTIQGSCATSYLVILVSSPACSCGNLLVRCSPAKLHCRRHWTKCYATLIRATWQALVTGYSSSTCNTRARLYYFNCSLYNSYRPIGEDCQPWTRQRCLHS